MNRMNHTRVLALSILSLSIPALGLTLSGCSKGSAPATEAAGEAEKSAPVAVEMAAPTVQAVEITVSAQGALTPAQGAIARVTAPVAGRLTAVLVHEGDHVHSGQLIARIDNRPQQAAAISARAAVTVASGQARSAALAATAAAADNQAAVRTARLMLDAAIQDRNAQIQQAQNVLDSAQTDLTKTKAGARPQEISQAQQTVTQAEVTRSRAQTELDRQQFLFDKGVAAKRVLEDATTSLAVASSTLTSTQQALSLLKAGARPEDLRAAELRVEGARNALTASQKSGDARVLQARAALQQAEQSKLQVAVKQQDALATQDMTRQKSADLAAAQATANYAEILAPMDGNVTKRSANPGDMADPAIPFLEISNPHGLNMIANLPVEDGLKVRAGMEAHITSADLPGKSYAGRVLSIGQVDPQSNLMTVRITVAGSGANLRAGAFVTADIVLRQIARAVVVPKSAVVTQDGKPTVFTIGADSTAHAHLVEVGPEVEDGKMVALLKGIEPKEQVVTSGNYELTEGAKIKPLEGDAADKKEAAKTGKVPEDSKDTKPDASEKKPAGANSEPTASKESDSKVSKDSKP